MAKRLQKVSVHAVLDTNCIVSALPHILLNKETTDLIEEAATNASEVETTWYLPNVVTSERRYQMLQRARRSMEHIGMLEKLLETKLLLSDDVLPDRVERAIAVQMKGLGVVHLTLDHSQVDWHLLIEAATHRSPPFHPGEKEKGFRDAIILETFCQLVERLPTSPSICRIYLVSSDGLLRQAWEMRVGERKNVRALETLEELRTIINALKSEISEEQVNEVLPLARKLFYRETPDGAVDKDCLYSRAMGEINQRQRSILESTPSSSGVASTRAVQIFPTAFIEKTRQKISFETKVKVEVEVTTFVSSSPFGISIESGPKLFGSIGGTNDLLSKYLSSSQAIPGGISFNKPTGISLGTSGLLGDTKQQSGEHIFAARWQATLSTSGKLVQPRFVTVEHLETKWTDPS